MSIEETQLFIISHKVSSISLWPCPHSSHLLGPQGIRTKQYGRKKKPTSPSHLMKSLTQGGRIFRKHTWHHEGNTEGAATTARHPQHSKSKAISCHPSQRQCHSAMRWSLWKVAGKDREHFSLQARNHTCHGWNFICKLSDLINHRWTAQEIHEREGKGRACRLSTIICPSFATFSFYTGSLKKKKKVQMDK